MEELNIAPSDLKFLIGKNGSILKTKIFPKGIKYKEGERPKVDFKVEDEDIKIMLARVNNFKNEITF